MRYLFLLSLIIIPVLGAPAFQGKRAFTQPDGSHVTYRNQGDENLHWSESDDGEIIIYNKDSKRFEYAEIKEETLQPSGRLYIKAVPSKKQSRSKTVTNHLDKEKLYDLYKIKRDKRLKRIHTNK